MDQHVTLPGHGQVDDGHRQSAFARRSQAAHVLSPSHCVDDNRAILGNMCFINCHESNNFKPIPKNNNKLLGII